MFVRIVTCFFITTCIIRKFFSLAAGVGTHPTASLERSSAAIRSQHSENLTRQIGFIVGLYVRHMRGEGAYANMLFLATELCFWGYQPSIRERST